MILISDSDIIITDEFKKTIDLLENSSKSVFITGKAGTGKSTLLKLFKNNTKKRVVILAPTGIAALNVGGMTIHKFFSFPPQLIELDLIDESKYTDNSLFLELDAIIIDEISMVRADLLDGIDYKLKLYRKNENPFGGVQMIFFGDLYQLSPIVKEKELKIYFEDKYGGYFFFNSDSYKRSDFVFVELNNVFRQKDPLFKNILDSIREDNLNDNVFSAINSRFNPDYYMNLSDDIIITLATTNKVAFEINMSNLSKIETNEFVYLAKINGEFDMKTFPTERILILKEGSQVMMLKNNGLAWSNGSIGIVRSINYDEINIEIDGVTYKIEKSSWEEIEYKYNKETKKIEHNIIGSFIQYPVKLAWAITIHKSQGLTLDRIIIDFGNGAFAHGQAYVALSRCTTLNGIILKTKLRIQDIIINDNVKKFMKENRFKF